MSIHEIPTTVYKAVCDTCGRSYEPRRRRALAASDLIRHECGVHRREHDSTGGHRGILAGWNVRCICGEAWVEDATGKPFKCPKDTSI